MGVGDSITANRGGAGWGWGNTTVTDGGAGETLQSQMVGVGELCSHRRWGWGNSAVTDDRGGGNSVVTDGGSGGTLQSQKVAMGELCSHRIQDSGILYFQHNNRSTR